MLIAAAAATMGTAEIAVTQADHRPPRPAAGVAAVAAQAPVVAVPAAAPSRSPRARATVSPSTMPSPSPSPAATSQPSPAPTEVAGPSPQESPLGITTPSPEPSVTPTPAAYPDGPRHHHASGHAVTRPVAQLFARPQRLAVPVARGALTLGRGGDTRRHSTPDRPASTWRLLTPTAPRSSCCRRG